MLALTMGDPAGIGGEIAVEGLGGAAARLRPRFTLLDDPARLRRSACPCARVADRGGRRVFADALPVLPVPLARAAGAGQPDPANAAAVIASIERAVRLVQSGAARAVVTNPISKAVLYAAGFAHPGHTEFLGALTGAPLPVMMLANRFLRVVPVTVHVSLRAGAGRADTG